MKEKKSNLTMGLILIVLGAFSVSANAADVAAGKAKAVVCASCHGENGISTSDNIPNLAGQKAGYIAKALRDFKSGARKNGMMSSVVGMIADSDIDNLAAYFSSLK